VYTYVLYTHHTRTRSSRVFVIFSSRERVLFRIHWRVWEVEYRFLLSPNGNYIRRLLLWYFIRQILLYNNTNSWWRKWRPTDGNANVSCSVCVSWAFIKYYHTKYLKCRVLHFPSYDYSLRLGKLLINYEIYTSRKEGTIWDAQPITQSVCTHEYSDSYLKCTKQS